MEWRVSLTQINIIYNSLEWKIGKNKKIDENEYAGE